MFIPLSDVCTSLCQTADGLTHTLSGTPSETQQELWTQTDSGQKYRLPVFTPTLVTGLSNVSPLVLSFGYIVDILRPGQGYKVTKAISFCVS